VVGTCHNQALGHRIQTKQDQKGNMLCTSMNSGVADFFCCEIAFEDCVFHLQITPNFELLVL
jgi:hypothetical protein